MDGKMKELVDLPGMCQILVICRLGTSGPLRKLHEFKKLYLAAKVPDMRNFSTLFALALADSGLEPPSNISPQMQPLSALTYGGIIIVGHVFVRKCILYD